MDWHAWCHNTKIFLKMLQHDILRKQSAFHAHHHALTASKPLLVKVSLMSLCQSH